jgi:hypothetical protein
MPITNRKNGFVLYELEQKTPFRLATNRQKKVLRFFRVPFGPTISVGAAGWEISNIMSDEGQRLRWHRYLFLTNDFGSDSDELKPCDPHALFTVSIPENWSRRDAAQQFNDELIAHILHDSSPFDSPMPQFVIKGHVFMFTGTFAFGSRAACQEAIAVRGGSAPNQKDVSRSVDFLVIGTKGSPTWKKGTYGNKIEQAILARREYGSPAIISEEHWLSILKEEKPRTHPTASLL